jgi:hypothetical protein
MILTWGKFCDNGGVVGEYNANIVCGRCWLGIADGRLSLFETVDHFEGFLRFSVD